MAYLINGTTIKTPHGFQRKQIDLSAENTSLTGRSTKDIFARKEQYILSYRNLTQAQASTILTEYDTQDTVTFESTETNLAISETICHMDVITRSYSKGADYIESFDVILTEVI